MDAYQASPFEEKWHHFSQIVFPERVFAGTYLRLPPGGRGGERRRAEPVPLPRAVT